MKKRPYENFSSFILRTPLFSFNFLQTLLSGASTSEDKLKEVCELPEVQEAIFLASPDLFNQMKEWLGQSEREWLKDRKKVEKLHYALMRYILRMSTRCTPFGLFAGFSIGKWADEDKVVLPEQAKYERHTRLDMNYLCALAQDLAKDQVIRENLLYYPNSSIYPVGDQLRYVEYRYINSRRTHHIVAVDRSEYLDMVLARASKGVHLKDLAELLQSDEDEITLEDARDFIEELIESQVLVNQLEPAITGPEFLDQIMAVLEPIKGIDEVKKIGLQAKNALLDVDSKQIGTTTANYLDIAKDLEPLKTGYELKFLFQTDMVKPTIHCSLDKNMVNDLMKGFEVMNKLSLKPKTTTLSQFRDAFFERYETMEVPLLQALDTESGVGYRQSGASGDIAPLVDDLALPGQAADSELRWNTIQSFLFKKYKESLQNDLYDVKLTDKELEGFKSAWDDLPDTFSCMIQIVEEGSESNPKPKVSLGGFGGSSAGNLLGRFCHGDRDTDTFVKEMTAKEKELNPDAILAEIIHLPESRVGNVLLRPVLRQYEIPYLAKAAVPPEDQLKVEDLMVSVQGNRVILRSKRLNKIIIPRLTNAHNYSYNALPVYHFLADMQTQDLRGGIGFNWGALANEYEFLPRVSYENLILTPATWNIKKDEIEDFLKIKDDIQLVEDVAKWRKEKKIPDHVALADSDNKLFLNLANALCIRTLFSVTKNRGGFQLVEFPFHPEDAIVKSENGNDIFTNEFVLSFYNNNKKLPGQAPREENKE
ncbi:MAG: hypothetical protein GY757_60320 [bacterium]|nr:hypothetical protein [bacterium]